MHMYNKIRVSLLKLSYMFRHLTCYPHVEIYLSLKTTVTLFDYSS